MKQNVLITGIGKGLGYEIFLECLKEGFFVYGIVRKKEDFLNLKKKFNNNQCRIYLGDIQSQSLLKKIFQDSKKLRKNINCLVNNAGERQRKSFLKISKNDLLNIFRNNFFNHFRLTQMYVKSLSSNFSNASVVNIGSIVGIHGFAQLSGYASTKCALDGLTKSLAIEFKDKNIRFNTIHPGFIKTSYFKNFKKNKPSLYKWTLSKIPLRRWGETNEVSKIVCFLLSDRSSYITGQSINVDGGWTIS